MWAFDAVFHDTNKEAKDEQAAKTFSRRFFTQALQEELLLRPIGNTVYLMPPYILNQEEISLVGERMLKVFNQVMGEAA